MDRRNLTAKDIPGKNLFGLINKDQPLLAHEKVRFVAKRSPLWLHLTGRRATRRRAAIEVAYEISLSCSTLTRP